MWDAPTLNTTPALVNGADSAAVTAVTIPPVEPDHVGRWPIERLPAH